MLLLPLAGNSQLLTYYGRAILPKQSTTKEEAVELSKILLKEEGEKALSQGYIKAKPEEIIKYAEIYMRVGYIDEINTKPLLEYTIELGLKKKDIFTFLETENPVAFVGYSARMVILMTEDYQFTQIFIKDNEDPIIILIDGKHLRRSNYVKYPYYIHYTGSGVGVNTKHTDRIKLR